MKLKNIYNHKKWKRKEKANRIKFKIERNIYQLGKNKSNAEKYFKVELNTLWRIFRQIIKAIIYLICMFLVSECINNIFLYFGWKQMLLEYLKYDKEIFINFLISTISIAGFLIALFYANLSGIFTTRYAHISSRISKELLNEHTNKKYINAIQNYIIVVLLVLISNIIGLYTDIILSIMVIVLTIRIIIIFIELSRRIFMYSDIAIIGQNTAQKITEVIEMVQVTYYKYDDQSFQSHHNKLVMGNIDTLNDLADSLVKDNDFEGLNKLLDINLYLIANYVEVKNKIPYNSLWFPDVYKTKIWFKESDHVLMAAVNTGTSLMPEQVRDIYFFENRLFEINLKIINYLFEENQLRIIYKYFEQYHHFISIFSKSEDVEYWYENIQENVQLIVKNIKYSKHNKNEYVIGLMDMVSLYQIDFVLDFADELEKIILNIQGIKLEEIDTKAVLKYNYYFMNNKGFHDFIKKLENERYIEGKLVTPKKIILEYI